MKLRLTTALTTALSALLIGAAPAHAQDKIKMKVMGQPISGGMIQKNKEQPFFETLAAKTGLPIEIEYKPQDTTGIKDTEQLRVLDSGLFDIVSLRMAQISRDEPLDDGLRPGRPEPRLQDRTRHHQGLLRHARQAPAIALRHQAAERVAGRTRRCCSARSRSRSSPT